MLKKKGKVKCALIKTIVFMFFKVKNEDILTLHQ